MNADGDGTRLPGGWEWAQLDQLGTWTGGGTPSKSVAAYWDGEIPWVSPKDMKALRLAGTEDCVTANAVADSATKRFPANSIALVTRSGILEHTLPVALVPFEATANQDMKVLTPRADVNPEWLLNALLGAAPEIRASCQKDGTTVASIDFPRLRRYRIPVPPSAEQTAIAECVTGLLAQGELAKADLDSALRKVHLLREATLEQCWPEGSPTVALEELLVKPLANGRSVPTSEEGFPVLRLTALRDGTIDVAERKGGAWTRSDAQSFLVHEGDFLVARGNGSLRLVGRGGLVVNEPDPVAFPDTLIRVRVDDAVMRRRFLRLIWHSRHVRDQLESQARTTAGIYKINQTMLRAVRLPVLSVEEQDQLIERAEMRLREMQQLGESIRGMLIDSHALKRSVLREALMGRLPVLPGEPVPDHVRRAIS